MSDRKTHELNVELTSQEAWDLAQFFKRSTFNTYSKEVRQ